MSRIAGPTEPGVIMWLDIQIDREIRYFDYITQHTCALNSNCQSSSVVGRTISFPNFQSIGLSIPQFISLLMFEVYDVIFTQRNSDPSC